MQATDYLQVFFRWIHIGAGVMWIGLLYFFNFVNGPFVATMDGETKKKVIPELAPRALYWFRWGAAYTWFTGILMLGIIYYMGNATLASGGSWTGIGYALSALFLISPYIYDALAKSPLAKNPKIFSAICFLLVVGLICLFKEVGGFGYRGYNMNVGITFGTIMAFNVWFRIWPAQQKIINGIKTGNPADASVGALAATRSKHNTYMSVPLIWMMINSHTTFLDGDSGWLILPCVILLGWAMVMMLYKKAAKVKGF
jgi:uncharacterized membrane protein